MHLIDLVHKARKGWASHIYLYSPVKVAPAITICQGTPETISLDPKDVLICELELHDHEFIIYTIKGGHLSTEFFMGALHINALDTDMGIILEVVIEGNNGDKRVYTANAGSVLECVASFRMGYTGAVYSETATMKARVFDDGEHHLEYEFDDEPCEDTEDEE